jgi:hypothetical protein
LATEFDAVFGAREDRVVEVTIFVPSADQNGKPIRDQQQWCEKALNLLGNLYGGATSLGPAEGVWKNPKTGQLVREEPILVYTYATEHDIHEVSKLRRLRDFCVELGKTTRQGEVALKIGDRLMFIPTW